MAARTVELAHVRAWKQAYRKDNDYRMNPLINRWLGQPWQITLQGVTFIGELKTINMYGYVAAETLDPAFEIEFDDRDGWVMSIRAHFGSFEPVEKGEPEP